MTRLNPTFLTLAFDDPENNQDTCIMGAYWVSEGADRCLIGHVNEGLKDLFPALDGRLAQVTEIYAHSANARKAVYSDRHNGVCFAMLVDKYMDNDDAFIEHLEIVSSDSENE